jgi:GNAT superfamily N-acetyltransferase
MLEISVRGWEDVDLHEVASLTFDALQASPFHNPERTLKDVEEWLNRNHERFPASAAFLARINGTLVGWLTVTVDVKSGTSDTWRWTPYLSPEAEGQEDEVARGLIRRCIEYVSEMEQTRLETPFDRVSDATLPHYEMYRGWFEAEGIGKVDKNAYMRRALTSGEFTAGDVTLPPGYGYMPLGYADEEALYDCYSRAFEESGGRSFHDMTEEGRRAEFKYYFLGAAVSQRASTVVIREEDIVGFSLVHSRPGEAHLADIGVAPGHRGRGLGRRMLAHSLMNTALDYNTVTRARRGGGGVIHQTVKTKPSNKRNPKTPPITIDSYQKEHKCMPKNTTQAREARKT